MSAAAGGRLWAITSYFNPLGYRSRPRNFRRFAGRIGVPLLVVEQSVGGAFELSPDDAERVVRVAGGDLMWQKERLLNVALDRLPADCEAVAWIDADVLFEGTDWVERGLRSLARWPLAQLFERLIHLAPGELPESARPPEPSAMRTSFAKLWRDGGVPADLFSRPEATGELRCNCGMAWIARRDLLARHGFYDGMILGMGDKLLAAAAVGRAREAAAAVRMSPRHREHYLLWAAGFAAEVAAAVGCVAGTAFHLWHGELADRRYVARYDEFARFDFDPRVDVALDASGAWAWEGAAPALRDHVAAYFAARREDAELEPHAL